ncbi:MAG: hypothetical protein QOG35_2613 [Solirubrobacteraceae bacterium]|jgi:hypothetical protein|nr:hypothetical protein [Solirubrobacteraceae bacterium]
MRRVIGFPHPVNEKAARVVAGGVALLSLAILATGWRWLLVVLAYGFWARVLTGPKLSPLGRFATALAAPRLGAPRYVAGPPKRFAQAVGAVVTTAAALCALVLGAPTVADVLTAAILVFATLESVFAFCVGCRIFAVLMSVGVVPDDVCAECADIWA